MSKQLIQVIDKDYVQELEKLGFKAIASNQHFTLMGFEGTKFNYSNLDKTKILLTNKMTF